MGNIKYMSEDPSIQDNDYVKQVLAYYQARHQTFIKVYTLFITFVFGFLAFILVPLIALKLDAESLPQEIDIQEKRLKVLQPNYEKLSAENSKLQENLKINQQQLTKLSAEQIEVELQAKASRKEVEKVAIQLEKTKEDKNIANIKLNAVRRALDPNKYPNLEGALKRIYDKTLKEAKTHESEISNLSAKEEALKKDFESAEKELSKIESQLKQISTQIEPIRQQAKEVETRAKTLEEELTNTNTELQRGQEAVAQMEQRQADIQSRLSNFQSPFGALPLSLTEASLAFPFIVAIGFLIYASLLADILNLRGEYHRILSTKQTIDEGTLRHRLVLVVPIWLDPLKTAWRNSGSAALVFLPALAYFVIVWLVTSGQLFELEAKRLDRNLIRFYNILYIAGALLVARGVWRILAEWKGYHIRIASKTP